MHSVAGRLSCMPPSFPCTLHLFVSVMVLVWRSIEAKEGDCICSGTCCAFAFVQDQIHALRTLAEMAGSALVKATRTDVSAHHHGLGLHANKV